MKSSAKFSGGAARWMRTYGTERPLRGSATRCLPTIRYRITELGRSVLAERPQRIDMQFLDRYESFRDFKTLKSSPTDVTPAEPEPIEQETPEEQLEAAYAVLRKALAQDLVERIKRCPPSFLERLVVDWAIDRLGE